MTARPDFRRAAARRARTAVLAAAAMLSGAGLAAGQARSGLPTGPTTGPVVLPAAAQGLQEPPAVPPAPAGPEKVHVRRLSDVVAVREGPRASERVLYYFNPNLMLSQSDHVEQGSGGQSELTLPGGATLQMHATAHVELSLLSPEGDVLRFPLLTRVEAAVLDRPLDLILPGGTQVHLVNTTLRVEAEPGRLSVRNTGSSPLPLHGDLRLHRSAEEETATGGELILQRGEEVIIPLFRVEGSEVGTVTDLWGLLTVRHHRGLQLQPDGDSLRLHQEADTTGAPEAQSPGAAGAPAVSAGTASAGGPAAATAVTPPEEASIGGVATRWVPGSNLVVRNPRHTERPPEAPPAASQPPAAAPTAPTAAPVAPVAPVAPPVPAGTAPADSPQPAPATGEKPAPAPAPGDEPAPAPAPAPAEGGGPAPKHLPPSPTQPSGAAKLAAGKESRS